MNQKYDVQIETYFIPQSKTRMERHVPVGLSQKPKRKDKCLIQNLQEKIIEVGF